MSLYLWKDLLHVGVFNFLQDFLHGLSALSYSLMMKAIKILFVYIYLFIFSCDSCVRLIQKGKQERWLAVPASL